MLAQFNKIKKVKVKLLYSIIYSIKINCIRSEMHTVSSLMCHINIVFKSALHKYFIYKVIK